MTASPREVCVTSSTYDGLNSTKAAALLFEIGANVLPEARPTPEWERVLRRPRSQINHISLFALAFDAVVRAIEGATRYPQVRTQAERYWLPLLQWLFVATDSSPRNDWRPI